MNDNNLIKEVDALVLRMWMNENMKTGVTRTKNEFIKENGEVIGGLYSLAASLEK